MTAKADQVSQEVTKFRQETRRRRLRISGAALLLVISLFAGIIGVVCKSTGVPGGLAWLLLSVVGVVLAALCISNVGESEARLGQELSDASAAGALIERRAVSFGSDRRRVEGLLIEQLQHIPSSDASKLSRAERARLDEVLRLPDFEQDTALLIAILFAYERVGDAESLPIVEALAARPGETPAERRVRDAARFCREGLRQRVERLRSSDALLRPADASCGADILLRAASETGQTPASELLRAPSEI